MRRYHRLLWRKPLPGGRRDRGAAVALTPLTRVQQRDGSLHLA
ncbi:MAG: hypothetical protein ACSLEW_02645 [Nocardioides sp.]